MGREVEVGLVVKLKDSASSGLKVLGESGRAFGRGLQHIRDAGNRAFSSIGSGIRTLNQGFGLLHRAIGVATQLYSAFVVPALEQRAATDAQKKAWEELNKEWDVTKGLLGDILLPILLGIGDAFKEVAGGADKYLVKNKQIIGSKIVEYLEKMAHILTTGIAGGIILVTRAWSGWVQLIGTGKAVVASYFAFVLTNYAKIFSALEEGAKALGLDGLAGKIGAARKTLAGLGKEFDATADASFAGVAKEVAEQDKLEATVNRVADAVHEGIGVAAVKAHERLGQAIQKVDKGAQEAHEKWLKQDTERLKRLEENTTQVQRAHEFRAQLELEAYQRVEENNVRAKAIWDEQIEKAKEAAEAIKDQITDAFNTVQGVATDVFQAISETVQESTENSGKAFANLFKKLGGLVLKLGADYIKSQIAQAAADRAAGIAKVTTSANVTAAKAAESQAGIPVAGPYLAAGALAAMLALVLGLLAGFNTGGLVPGVGDQDSVIAKVTPGELILDKKTAKGVLRAAGQSSGGSQTGLPGFATGGMVTPQMAGTGGGIHFHTHSDIPTSQVDKIRYERDVLKPAAERLKALGLISIKGV